MFYQIFLSPEVKQCAITTYKHGIYELPHEFPNDLRLTKLGNIRKVSKLYRMMPSAQSPHQNENFVNNSKKVPKNSD